MTYRSRGKLQTIPDVLDAEIRAFGSNTITSIFRSGSAEYHELATDVAKKLDGKPEASHDLFDIEGMIIDRAVNKYMREKTFSDYAAMRAQVAQVVKVLVSGASGLGGFVASGGAAAIAGAVGGRLVTLVAPPLAVATAGATLYQVASPAFRITVPAVLQIAQIRRARYRDYSGRRLSAALKQLLADMAVVSVPDKRCRSIRIRSQQLHCRFSFR